MDKRILNKSNIISEAFNTLTLLEQLSKTKSTNRGLYQLLGDYLSKQRSLYIAEEISYNEFFEFYAVIYDRLEEFKRSEQIMLDSLLSYCIDKQYTRLNR